jgi:hypothetical protein
MRKAMKRLAVFVIPHALVLWFCLITVFLNLASPFLNGFAVDSTGRVYVGENETINIYEDSVKVGSIELEGPNYEFTVDQNNRVVVAYTSEVCLLDSSGIVLETKEDPGMDTFYEIHNKRSASVTVGGDRYKKEGALGWTRIIRNGTEVVYRLSVLSFTVKMLLILCTVSMLVNGVWVITYGHKNIQEEKSRGKTGGGLFE